MLGRLLPLLVFAAALGALGGGAYLTRDRWEHLVWPPKHEEAPHAEHSHGDRVKITPQARNNLGLIVRPVKLSPIHWRTMAIPATVVDRPGQSDQGVTAPIAGVVARIHAYPSDTVKPGAPLFDLRITSEFVQNAQAELFKTVQDVALVEKKIKRLEASRDTVPEAQVIQAHSERISLAGRVRSYRQMLQVRGMTSSQIDEAAAGRFVREVTVYTPADGRAFEVQELKAQPGEHVQAGQILVLLANHRLLYIEGHGFKDEAARLTKSAENGWPVEVEFAEDDADAWPTFTQTLVIRHLANSMDATSRTFSFYIALTNQSRHYERDNKAFLVWRFRPGQRVRLHVKVSPRKDVIVLPAAAVVREGPEAYVFRANGDAFDRKPVTVLYEDRREVVLANDGSISPGVFVAQNAAAALNRTLAAQKAGEGGGGHDHHGHHH